LAGIENVFGRRQPRARVEPRQGCRDILGRPLGEQRLRQHQNRRRCFSSANRVSFSMRSWSSLRISSTVGAVPPDGVDAREIEQQFRPPLARRRHQQGR